MDKKIGFIGCGNMGQAMLRGILNSRLVGEKDIIVSAKSQNTLDEIKEEFGVLISLENREIAKEADIIILAVKPYLYGDVLEEIVEYLKKDCIIVSIGAGISLEFLQSQLKEGSKVVKTMPNTPAIVGEGISAITFGKNVLEGEIEDILKIFKSFGKVEIIDEKLMDGFTAICGSSPAYIFMLIEAMSDAAVKEGIPKQMAYNMSAQAVLGAAKMVLETGEHPGKLKDNVSSPGGTTIEAIISLEKTGFRSSIMEAVRLCAKKSRDMGSKNS